MKGHVGSSRLTKFDVFQVNRDKLWTLKHGSKFIQTSVMLRQCPPKPYELLKIFYPFCDNRKILSFTYHLKEAEFAHFYEYCRNPKTFEFIHVWFWGMSPQD